MALNKTRELDPPDQHHTDKVNRFSHESMFLFSGKYGLVILLAVIIAVFALLRPDSFNTWENYRSILATQVAPLILAVAVLIVLVVGHFDLSVAATVGLSQILVVSLIAEHGWSPVVAITAALAVSALIGFINGFVVIRLKVGSFIATLATGGMIAGVQLWYTGGETLFKPISPAFTTFGRGALLGVPNVVILAAVICTAVWFILNKLPLGRRMYVIGGSERAAVLAGINTNRYVWGAFAASSLLAGVAGVVLGAQFGTAQPGGGDSLLIPAFTGALLSTATIQLARFNVLGTVVAVMVLAVTVSGMQQLGAALWVQPFFNGFALIVAVALSSWATRTRSRQARRKQLEALSAQHGAT